MPFRSVNQMDERIAFVLAACCQTTSMTVLCKQFGISRPTGYRWLNRYKQTGSVTALAEQSRRPQHSPSKTPLEIEQHVVALRNQYGWGARKLHYLLAREQIQLPVSTIHAILKRNDLIRALPSHRPATQRFERSQPNQLWQMDFKGDYPAASGRCYPLSLLDDHSRYCVGLGALRRPGADEVKLFLISAFQRHGLPDAILADHGTPWWSNTNVRGLTRLSVWLLKQEIKLLHGAIAHPQTQGKVERFHRTLSEDLRFHGVAVSCAHERWQERFDRFRAEYNQVRPHESLDQKPPSSRYCPSTRRYRSEPVAWQYPAGAIVKRLNPQGCLNYQQSRYFVSEALAGELVQVEHLQEKLLIRYRGEYVREIAAKTRRTVAIQS